MIINLNTLNRIYSMLGDDISKEIFKNRIMMSVSNNEIKWERGNVMTNRRIKEFIAIMEEQAKNRDIVIFGGGKRGKDLYQIINNIPWKYFIDTNPVEKKIGTIPVIAYENFVKNYHGECIVISSRIYRKEMERQLRRDGITDNIFNFGNILENMIQDQYFDLEIMRPISKKEVFVDVGCYDGMSSLNFGKWCKRDFTVYAFEPQKENFSLCKSTLENNNISYKLIQKGAWSEETTLKFKISMGMASQLYGKDEIEVDVTRIDKILANEKVTFIKMDIEGAELEALIGAQNVISNNKPILAISVYHRFEDIFSIPELILKYNPEYQFYLRHYSIRSSETVLYALPEAGIKGKNSRGAL